MKIADIISLFENFAPLYYQENYDNSGLQVGNINQEIKAISLCIDVTEEVVEEAIRQQANLIISHHPVIADIISLFENFAPLYYQENYDNSGLQVGNINQEIKAISLCIDVTEEVVEEAIRQQANLIISHHPVIFSSLKKITNQHRTGRIITKAIINDIAIYTVHTNLDNVYFGVNKIISQKLSLHNLRILSPKKNDLNKLVTFIPIKSVKKVREAIFDAGAGNIGNYSSCSFNALGEGTFLASQATTPFVGKKNELHTEKEVRFETIFPSHLQHYILQALLASHPYEEVAYDIYPLNNFNPRVGAGMIGELAAPIKPMEFLKKIQTKFNAKIVRYSDYLPFKEKVKRVALCGGNGSFLIGEAIQQKADIFITGDIKYHQFFQTENKIIIVDVGHFESEQFTIEIFYNLIKEKYPTIVIFNTKIDTNPVKYITT